jgi:diguanylate cyclase (GGDEF)-like protein
MALQEVALRVTFAGGIETKMDSKSVPVARLLALQDAVFTRAVSLSKRFGYASLGLAVLGVGALLLRTRLTSITALEEAEALSQRLATTDPLTGLLSQSGMESILPRFVGTAHRTGDSVCVMYITVPELDRAVREYGRDYGNAVIGAVADAVRDTVREGDLVARWRSAGFLVAGFGLQPDSRMLTTRVQQQVTSRGVDRGKWPITVRAGTAAGSADEHAVAVLIGAAEADSGADADAAEGVRTLA